MISLMFVIFSAVLLFLTILLTIFYFELGDKIHGWLMLFVSVFNAVNIVNLITK